MFTIDYVTSRDSDTPAKTLIVNCRPWDGATALAEMLLAETLAGARRDGAPIIGYLVRTKAGRSCPGSIRGLVTVGARH